MTANFVYWRRNNMSERHKKEIAIVALSVLAIVVVAWIVWALAPSAGKPVQAPTPKPILAPTPKVKLCECDLCVKIREGQLDDE